VSTFASPTGHALVVSVLACPALLVVLPLFRRRLLRLERRIRELREALREPRGARPSPDGPRVGRQRPQRMRAAAPEGFDRLKERAPAGAGALSALGVTQAMAAIMASAISEVPTAVGSLGSALRS